MKKIAVITTGGTIACTTDPETGRSIAGKLTGEKLLGAYKDLSSDQVELEVFSAFQIPSNAMDFDKLLLLKSVVESFLIRTDISGVVITHGTDTLEETSYFLSLAITSHKPVVNTGSQRIPGEIGSDSFANIRDAITLAAADQPDCSGTLLVFNEKIFSPRSVRKVHTSNVDGFAGGQIGTIDRGEVFIQCTATAAKACFDTLPALAVVQLIKAASGMSDLFIRAASTSNAQGLVIEGFGRGHVPPGWLPAIKAAVDSGMKVVITSACDQGRVYPAYEYPGSFADLTANGVISGQDLDAKKARILLACLIGSGQAVDSQSFL
ncbi:asparaginase [Marinobacterium mangrovicola]|uniref:Asparaginase n=1 Tax=Marinobacterium mangrovicola TaxID=1476959 RepID=A0A4R1GC44_9GAMM|nr:asparaginase [Marinobacterium mangrovicola]TCK04085.1 asparaginase [Marinobacterium mangrovicola]